VGVSSAFFLGWACHLVSDRMKIPSRTLPARSLNWVDGPLTGRFRASGSGPVGAARAGGIRPGAPGITPGRARPARGRQEDRCGETWPAESGDREDTAAGPLEARIRCGPGRTVDRTRWFGYLGWVASADLFAGCERG